MDGIFSLSDDLVSLYNGKAEGKFEKCHEGSCQNKKIKDTKKRKNHIIKAI